MEIRQYLTEPSVDLQKISRKSTQTKIHIHTDTHTYTYRELRQLPSLPISWFWSWRPLFILMPMARNPIHGSRSLRRLHVSAAGSASAAASAGVAWCWCWRVENQLYVDSAAAVVGNAHLPSAQCVCVWAIEEKHLQIFYLRQFSFIHATAAHVVSVADFLAVAACLFDTIGQLLLPINNYH